MSSATPNSLYAEWALSPTATPTIPASLNFTRGLDGDLDSLSFSGEGFSALSRASRKSAQLEYVTYSELFGQQKGNRKLTAFNVRGQRKNWEALAYLSGMHLSVADCVVTKVRTQVANLAEWLDGESIGKIIVSPEVFLVEGVRSRTLLTVDSKVGKATLRIETMLQSNSVHGIAIVQLFH